MQPWTWELLSTEGHNIDTWRSPCFNRFPRSTNHLFALKPTFIFSQFKHKNRICSRMTGSAAGGPNAIMENTHQSSKLEMKDPLVVCFGEMLVDFVPTVVGVSLAEAPAFSKSPGGAPANVAVGISRLGGSSAFIGKVGQDDFGYMLAEVLKDNKVDASGLRFDSSARTALSFVSLRGDGEREFLFFRHPSADILLRQSELDIELVKKGCIFHFGSISMIEEPCRSTQLAAMNVAKESGSLLSYDPNLRLPLWSSPDAARKGIFSIWDKADIIKISDEEVSFLTNGGGSDDDNVVIDKLLHPNIKLLLVSEGSKGCRYYTKDFHGKVGGLIKVEPVDTTGAGDAFMSGVLSCLASDLNLYKDEKKLRNTLLFANACGGLAITGRGAIPALPTRDAVFKKVADISK